MVKASAEAKFEDLKWFLSANSSALDQCAANREIRCLSPPATPTQPSSCTIIRSDLTTCTCTYTCAPLHEANDIYIRLSHWSQNSSISKVKDLRLPPKWKRMRFPVLLCVTYAMISSPFDLNNTSNELIHDRNQCYKVTQCHSITKQIWSTLFPSPEGRFSIIVMR